MYQIQNYLPRLSSFRNLRPSFFTSSVLVKQIQITFGVYLKKHFIRYQSRQREALSPSLHVTFTPPLFHRPHTSVQVKGFVRVSKAIPNTTLSTIQSAVILYCTVVRIHQTQRSENGELLSPLGVVALVNSTVDTAPTKPCLFITRPLQHHQTISPTLQIAIPR